MREQPFNWESETQPDFEPEPLYLPVEAPRSPEEKPSEPQPEPPRVIVIPIA